MIIPRFTVRWLLVLTALCGVVAYVFAQAIAGRVWAIALSAALASLVVTMLLHAGVFLFSWGIAETWYRRTRRRQVASPFATHTPPPQLVRPQELDAS